MAKKRFFSWRFKNWQFYEKNHSKSPIILVPETEEQIWIFMELLQTGCLKKNGHNFSGFVKVLKFEGFILHGKENMINMQNKERK